MIVLGIETSCDETGAAIVRDDGVVLSDVVESQIASHAPFGGVVPEVASRDHVKNIGPVVRSALADAKLTLAAVDAIAVTCRPGLVGALLVGVQVAKGIAFAAEKPLIGVDHLVGHLLAVFLRNDNDSQQRPTFPFVALLASGGHTAIYRVDGPSPSACTELGATRDDAAGEAFDKVAKLLGLGYPGGPEIDRRATRGNANAIAFKTPMPSSLEMSFSGLKTQVARYVETHRDLSSDQIDDVCAAFQQTATKTLADKLIRAAREEKVQSVVLGGGVSANAELRRRVHESASKYGISAFVPPPSRCTDNAAMIAYAGAMRFASGEHDGFDLTATSQTSLPRKTRKGRGDR
ncbi:MAG: tRNA (adenosine(37)-N6)-threonylcarbamoyltransferase complex transferase subunit TsaD [Polyangiaceae bacterium]